MNKLLVTSSPHVGSQLTTKSIMLHMIIALSFPLAAGVALFGFYPLVVAILSVGGSVLGETLYNLMRKRKNTLGDFSAVVTGMILGLILPPYCALYVPVIGGIFATIFVKMLFGGLGKNFANPAGTARVFLLLSWTGPLQMKAYAAPLDYATLTAKEFFTKGFDNFLGLKNMTALVTSATPLAEMKTAADGGGAFSANLLDMFLGNIGGAIGETCVIAILAGAAYLIAFKIINWKIPAVYIAGTAVFVLLFYIGCDGGAVSYILPSILGGGLLFGGVYMLTDYSTSSTTRTGIVIYALTAALLTVLIRRFGNMDEGASVAILLANCLAPLIDRATKPKPFGYKKPAKKKKEVAAQ